jgi:hypothetical protein
MAIALHRTVFFLIASIGCSGPESVPPPVPDKPVQVGACFDGKGGAPEIAIGGGQSDYTPVADGAIVKAEAGPQGGHHVWIGVRMKNLGQALTRTIVRGTVPSTGQKIPEAAFVFSYGPDEGGYCKLYGLRYQFDGTAEGKIIDYRPFLGQAMDLEVEAIDTNQRSAKKTLHILLADTL